LKRANLRRKWSKTISKTADNLSEAGWSWGCVATVDATGRTIWVVAAERNAQRFIVHADEKLTAFVELEATMRAARL
jgi:hypothetical protein